MQKKGTVLLQKNNQNSKRNSNQPARTSRHDTNDEINAILVSVPTDGGYGWIITAMAFLMYFICEGIINSFGKLLLPISEDFDTNEANVAFIGSMFDGLHFICGAFASALINIFGFRTSGIIGTVIASTFMYVASTANSIITLTIFHAFVGVGTGTISCVASICLGYHFDKYRPFAYGIATSGTGAGTIAMFPIVTLILGYGADDAGHWRQVMQCYSAILAFCVLLSLLAAKPKTIKIKQSRTPPKAGTSTVDDDSSDDDVSTVSVNKLSRLSLKSNISTRSARISIFSAPDQPTLAEMLELNREIILQKKRLHKKLSLHARVMKRLKRHKSRAVKSQPLSRDDIMYTQSTYKIAERRATEMNLEISPSSGNLNNQLLLLRMERSDAEMKMLKKIKFRFWNSVKLIFDFSMFKSRTFKVLCIGSFFFAAGLFIPFMYLTDRAMQNGMPTTQALWLVSVIGLGNIFLRCFIGIAVTFFPNINAVNITTYSLVIAGVATITTAFFPAHPFYLQAIYCVCFALGNACVMALRSIIYVNILGIERLTNAFGILSTMFGVGIMLGTPALGSLKTFTGNYCLTFVGSGVCFLVSAVCYQLLPRIKQWEEHKLERNQFQLS